MTSIHGRMAGTTQITREDVRYSVHATLTLLALLAMRKGVKRTERARLARVADSVRVVLGRNEPAISMYLSLCGACSEYVGERTGTCSVFVLCPLTGKIAWEHTADNFVAAYEAAAGWGERTVYITEGVRVLGEHAIAGKRRLHKV